MNVKTHIKVSNEVLRLADERSSQQQQSQHGWRTRHQTKVHRAVELVVIPLVIQVVPRWSGKEIVSATQQLLCLQTFVASLY